MSAACVCRLAVAVTAVAGATGSAAHADPARLPSHAGSNDWTVSSGVIRNYGGGGVYKSPVGHQTAAAAAAAAPTVQSNQQLHPDATAAPPLQQSTHSSEDKPAAAAAAPYVLRLDNNRINMLGNQVTASYVFDTITHRIAKDDIAVKASQPSTKNSLITFIDKDRELNELPSQQLQLSKERADDHRILNAWNAAHTFTTSSDAAETRSPADDDDFSQLQGIQHDLPLARRLQQTQTTAAQGNTHPPHTTQDTAVDTTTTYTTHTDLNGTTHLHALQRLVTEELADRFGQRNGHIQDSRSIRNSPTLKQQHDRNFKKALESMPTMRPPTNSLNAQPLVAANTIAQNNILEHETIERMFLLKHDVAQHNHKAPVIDDIKTPQKPLLPKHKHPYRQPPKNYSVDTTVRTSVGGSDRIELQSNVEDMIRHTKQEKEEATHPAAQQVRNVERPSAAAAAAAASAVAATTDSGQTQDQLIATASVARHDGWLPQRYAVGSPTTINSRGWEDILAGSCGELCNRV